MGHARCSSLLPTITFVVVLSLPVSLGRHHGPFLFQRCCSALRSLLECGRVGRGAIPIHLRRLGRMRCRTVCRGFYKSFKCVVMLFVLFLSLKSIRSGSSALLKRPSSVDTFTSWTICAGHEPPTSSPRAYLFVGEAQHEPGLF